MAGTKRAMAVQMFHRASHVVPAKHGNTSETARLFASKRKPFSALQLVHELDDLETSVSAKSPRRRRLNENQKTCCSGKAYNWEVGVAAGAGITVSGSVSLSAGGFNGWSGDTCYFKTANVREVCLNWDFGFDMDGPLEVEASVARGFFKSYNDMLGESAYVGGSACFILCVGGSVITNLQGQHIGETLEFGVDFEGGICTCTNTGNTYSKTFYGLKPNCPSGCFPEDATVETPDGKKKMHQLRVGDRVLAVNDAGEAFFDEIYFFVHADHKAMSPMGSWVLDHFAPEALTKYLPATYQLIFVVGRWIYRVFGARAADVIGVNNPQEQTPWSAYAVALSSIFVASCPVVVAVFLKSRSGKL
eukprot:s4623_g5.t1